ncbi:MAG TPA: hypothetical protein VFE50_22330 [Cyclobacteriaceae bacterium]|nr:hypothetical protein [Cyclobacteriaceae bacterium]
MRIFMMMLVVGLCSCRSTGQFQVSGHPPLTKENISKINGDYNSDAWKHLKLLRGKYQDDPSHFVRLTARSENLIEAKLMTQDQTILAEALLPGRIKENGYFSATRKVFLIPIPLLTWYSTLKSDLILNSDNDLYVAYNRSGFAIVLLFSGGDKDLNGAIHKRLR